MNEMTSVPYVVYEQEKVHASKAQLRLVIVILVLIVAFVGSNLAWIIYESQFETVTEEEIVEHYEYDVEQDGESGTNNFIGHDGDITNGTAEN